MQKFHSQARKHSSCTVRVRQIELDKLRLVKVNSFEANIVCNPVFNKLWRMNAFISNLMIEPKYTAGLYRDRFHNKVI